MTLERRTWEECRIFWEAKGYKLDSLTPEFLARFGAKSGYGRSMLGELGRSTELAPSEVVELVWSLPLRPEASRRKYEIVQHGLEKGAPLADLEALVADAGARLNTLGASIRGGFDVVGASLNHADSRFDLMDARLDLLKAQHDKNKRQIIRSVWVTGFLVIVAVAFVQSRQAPHPPSSSSSFCGMTAGGVDARTLAQMFEAMSPFFLGAFSSNLGEKVPAERYVPSEPLPGQKREPCDARLGEEVINTGCWFGSDAVKPPCGLLFRNGNRCFRPVAADPKVPVRDEPRRPDEVMPAKEP